MCKKTRDKIFLLSYEFIRFEIRAEEVRLVSSNNNLTTFFFFQLYVEDKQGYSKFEMLCEELQRQELREKAKKEKKKKRKKNKKNDEGKENTCLVWVSLFS